MARSAAIRLVELEQKGNLRTLLLGELNAGSTQAEIARKWGVSELTVGRWIKDEELEREVIWRARDREVVAA